MCSLSIDLSYFCPQKYATTYIHHTHYVLLLFLEVPPTYTHYTLCCFYPRDTHLCCSYPRSTHTTIHIPHPLRKCFTPTVGEDTQKYPLCLIPLIHKAVVIAVDTPYCYRCIKRVGWSIKKEKREKKERGQRSQSKRKERQLSPYFFRLGRYVIPKEQL